MKKLLLLVLGIVLFVNTNSRASALNDLFSYDETLITSSLSDVAMLENYVNEHSGITLSDLVANSSDLSKEISLDVNFLTNLSGGNNPVLGIPSFVWGCVLNWVGILIVYLVSDQDMGETKKAIIGCVVGAVVYTGVWLVYYLVVLAAYSGI